MNLYTTTSTTSILPEAKQPTTTCTGQMNDGMACYGGIVNFFCGYVTKGV